MSHIFIENIFRNNSSGMIKILNKKPSIKLHICKSLIYSIENNNYKLQTEKNHSFVKFSNKNKQTGVVTAKKNNFTLIGSLKSEVVI
jgi:hypothetical protein